MQKQKIAFYCHNFLMAEHLFPCFESIQEISLFKIEITILYNPKHCPKSELIKIESLFGRKAKPFSKWQALFKSYDYLFIADHISRKITKLSKSIIHIGHGHPSKVLENEKNNLPYEYDHHVFDKRGQLKYQWFIESCELVKHAINKQLPSTKSRIIVLGNGADDKFINENINYSGDKPLVIILSTYGKDSSLDYVINAIYHNFENINKQFQILFDLHPLCEKRNTESFNKVKNLVEKGALLKPKHGHYYKNAVRVISDHTSMVQKVALLNNNIVMIPINETLLWEHGATKRIYNAAPRYNLNLSFEQNCDISSTLACDPDNINSKPGQFKKNMRSWFEKLVTNGT